MANLLHEQLLEYLKAQGYRTSTVKGYVYTIKPFLFYLQETGVDIKEVTAQNIQTYQAIISERECLSRPGKLSSGARHKIMSSIKTFFRFLHKTGRIYHDPCANIVLPKKGYYLPRALLSVDEILEFLKQPDLTTPIGIRNRAIMELMYSSGLRNGETTMLEVIDVDMVGKTVFVHGKGGRDAVVPFGSEASKALEHYLYFARDELLKARGTGRPVSAKRKQIEKGSNPLFLTAQGFRITTYVINHLVGYYAKKAGIEKPITPHGLRHTCATHLLRNGADIRLIQRLLRHADIGSTQIYTRVAIEDIKDAQKKYHPRESVKDE